MSEENTYGALRKLIKFPSRVDFRIIVEANHAGALDEVRKTIAAIEPDGLLPATAAPRQSAKGNYVSHTVSVTVSAASNLEKIYKAVGMLPFVRHII